MKLQYGADSTVFCIAVGEAATHCLQWTTATNSTCWVSETGDSSHLLLYSSGWCLCQGNVSYLEILLFMQNSMVPSFRMDKNSYIAGETAQIHVDVDNQSAVDIENFAVKVCHWCLKCSNLSLYNLLYCHCSWCVSSHWRARMMIEITTTH